MDLQRIRYFIEVVRQRNFSKAAAICHVSQPSLSQQIMKLEAETGGTLLLRNRGRIELTEHGHAFLRHAQAIMAEVETAQEFVSESRGRAEGTIRIGAIPTIAPYLIPGLFARLKRRLPKAHFELREEVTASLVEALGRGEIDFALLSPRTAIDDVADSHLLRKDRLMLTLPCDHTLSRAKRIQISKLKEERAILLGHAHCFSEQAASYCEAVGLGADVTIRTSQIETMLGLVEAGFGFAFTPEIAIPHHGHRKVTYRRIASRPYFREIRIYWMKRHILSRMHHTILESAIGEEK